MTNDTSTPKTNFPANVPLKLIKIFREEKENYSALARRLNVNKGMLWTLLNEGKEPHDENTRKKVFLPRKIRAPLAAWVREATQNLADLEAAALPTLPRTYNRKGKRVW